MQPLFQQRSGLTLRFLFFLVLSIVLMLTDHRYNTFRSVRTSVSTAIIYPLQVIVDAPFRLFRWGSESLASHNALLAENRLLQSQALEHQIRLQLFESLKSENNRLRELLKSAPKVGEDVLVAELLTVNLDPYRQQITLNKGASHGVFVGQPVIDAKGVVGQTSHVSQFSSMALLISDPAHALPVQTSRSGTRTIAQGTGNPHELDLLYLPNNADIRVGDLIVTSGLAGRFPRNYPVGVIASIDLQPNKSFAKVKATPLAALDKSHEVLLVWPPKRPDA